MDNNFFTFIIIPMIVLVTMGLSRYLRNKLAKPKQEGGVQKPGGFDRFIVNLITFITFFSGFFTIIGALMGELEMTIVFAVLTLIFIGITLFLRRKHNITYQENSDFFIVTENNKEYKVHYKNIADWKPDYNQIKVLDKTQEEADYIDVNIAIFKPEILLQKLIEMTLAGKFQQTGHFYEDPLREEELINYLENNGYGYLVEDVVG